MQLKNKKRLLNSNELIHNLKRGYIIKGISSEEEIKGKSKKDRNKTYEILDVKSIQDGEKLIQIKIDDIMKNRIEDDEEN